MLPGTKINFLAIKHHKNAAIDTKGKLQVHTFKKDDHGVMCHFPIKTGVFMAVLPSFLPDMVTKR